MEEDASSRPPRGLALIKKRVIRLMQARRNQIFLFSIYARVCFVPGTEILWFGAVCSRCRQSRPSYFRTS